MEEQVADPELDLDQRSSSEDDEAPRAPAVDQAPQCAGCHRRGVSLLLLENGKRYCDGCAQEVERLMGIGPLVPGGELISDDSSDRAEPAELAAISEAAPAAPSPVATDEPAATVEPLASVEPPASDEPAGTDEPLASVEPAVTGASAPEAKPAAPAEPASEVEEREPGEDTPTAASISIDRSTADTLAADAVPESPDIRQATDSDVSSEAAPRDTGSDESNLTTLVSRQNREAAQASAGRIKKPQLTRAISTEEPPLMERVQEQTRPASPIGALSSDLLGALSAERARLLEHREVLEARFRAETQSIDERLLHVESLLGDESESLAS